MDSDSRDNTCVMVSTVNVGAWSVIEICFRGDKDLRDIHVAWIPVGMLP